MVSRGDRAFLIALCAFLVLESAAGLTLGDVRWLTAPLFFGDTFVAIILLTFALAIEPNDREAS
jgi:hypothetical protein